MGGLFFIAFMKNPNQFVNLRQRLGTKDALNEYVSHVGSAIFAIPPGLRQGQQYGDGLLE
jgi:deferrochelatase/peroxidase EfeB